MVLMHRKDIIEKYGFDPAENSSVVPKGSTTAAINVVPDAEKLEAPSQETESAGALNNLAAGAAKSFYSDPLALAGLASGLAYWGWQKAKGNKDASFMEGLYQEGGVEKVKQHLEDYQKQVALEHPDWEPQAVTEAVERYQGSPEFFQFNTDHMSGPMRLAMQNAYKINKKLGVDKTPFQETFTDDTLQTLGGLLTPTGFLKVANVGQRLAGKAGKYIGHAVEMAAVPGVGKYTPGNIAGNLGVGMAIDEVQRQVTNDPTVLPSGEALLEYRKDVGRLPIDIPAPEGSRSMEPLSEAQAVPATPLPTNIPTTEAGMGTLGGAALLVGGAGLAARQAFRGRVAPPTINFNPQTFAEGNKNARILTTGLDDPVDPNPVHRAIEYADEKGDLNAPAYQLGRELGVEEQIQAVIGQELSPHGQQLTVRNIWEDGVFPNNERLAPLKQNFDIFASAKPEEQAIVNEAIKGLNVLSEIEWRSRAAAEEAIDLRKQAIAKPYDAALQSQAADKERVATMWRGYDHAIRRYAPDRTKEDWEQAVNIVLSDPRLIAQLENYKDAVQKVNYTLRSGGIISHQEFLRRNREEPYHAALFEYDPTTGIKYDPTKDRDPYLGRSDANVFNIIDPYASLRVSFEIAARAASNHTGRRNAIEAFSTADPHGRDVQVMTPEAAQKVQYGYNVRFKDRNGKEMVAKFARQSVADTLNQAPIDDGIAWNFVNSIRTAAQFGMVHGAAGVAQAPVSSFYNMVTGFIGQRSGTSVGYVSRMLRSFGLERSADVADAILPLAVLDRAVAYGATGIHGAWLRAARATGHKMATQAITQDGLFGLIARTVPNGEQHVAKLGADLGEYYHNSWLAHYMRWVESGAHATVFDKVATSRAIQRDIKKWAEGAPRGFLNTTVRLVFDAYNSVLNHVASLHNMTQVAQDLAVKEAQLGRPLRLDESRIIGERARISAGDMAAQPGSTGLRRAGYLIPFWRIGMASTRYLMHAMTSRGAWDSGLVLTRLGSVAGAIYASQLDIENLGLTNWYYERLNDFERIGKLRLLKMEHRIAMLRGEKPKLDMENPDNNFYVLPLPQEAAIFLGGIMYGLEQLGFVNRGSNRGNTSAEKDMLYNSLLTFNMGNIPAASLGAAVLGYKLDLNAFARDRPTLSQIQSSKTYQGDMPSGIPSTVAEVTKSLFGFNGQLFLNSIDAGVQDYKKNQSYLSATHRAWDEGVGMWKEKTIPTIPGVWDGARKHYAFDAVVTETNRIKGVAKTLETAYQNNFTAAGARRGENRRMIADPQIKQMLALTHVFFERGGLPKIQERLNIVRNKLDNIQGSKGKMSYEEVETQKKQIYKEMLPWQRRQTDVIQKYERLLATRFADRFKAEGLEPNVDSVAKLVGKYSQ